jgi:ABC-type transport system involved in multi-copper enzyme maturation permease subunit
MTIQHDKAASPVSPTGPRTSAPAFGRLVRAEFARLAARRFTRVALGLSAIGYLIAVGLLWHTHNRTTPADIAQATAQRDQQIVQDTAYIEQCKSRVPAEQQLEACGMAPTPESYPITHFLSNQPFPPSEVADFALAVGVATAMLAFLLAATFIGAEWSSKNLIAWLFWEPRRLRVMAAKLLALLSSVLVLAVLAQLVWFGTAKLLLHYRGNPVSSLGAEAEHFWSDVVSTQSRAALLVLVTALIGFGLASLMRNSAAALGVAFVYFAVVENVIRALNPELQPYLFTTNIAAWIADSGITVYGKQVYDPVEGYLTAREIVISNAHGGVMLLVFAGVVTAAALAVFARRDLS